MFIDKAKNLLWAALGWLAAVALGAMWFLSRRRPNATTSDIRVEPKKVPETDEEVLKEARKEGIIR